MTTFELVLLLCVWVATVGLAIYLEIKFSGNCCDEETELDPSLTRKSIISVLKHIGVKDIREEENGIAFNYQGN